MGIDKPPLFSHFSSAYFQSNIPFFVVCEVSLSYNSVKIEDLNNPPADILNDFDDAEIVVCLNYLLAQRCCCPSCQKLRFPTHQVFLLMEHNYPCEEFAQVFESRIGFCYFVQFGYPLK